MRLSGPVVSIPVAAALLCSLASVPSLGGGPLANCNAGRPSVWGGGGVGIPFNPDQGGLGQLTNDEAVALVELAFSVWEGVPSSTASYSNAGQLPFDVDITNFVEFILPTEPDGLSAIVFDETGEIFDLIFGTGSGILGFAGPEWVDSDSCEIIEGVSFLDGPMFTDGAVALDVMVHEFGHYSNLGHTVVNGQVLIGDTSGPTPFNTFGFPTSLSQIETMYPFYFGPGSNWRFPHRDDIASLSSLYPAPGFFSQTGSISGTVFLPNGETELTGINVIARNVADPFDDAVSMLTSALTEDFTPGAPFVGAYALNGLTPGAEYAIFVDRILAGGFSTPPEPAFPGPEEFYNAENESNNVTSEDRPDEFITLVPPAGKPLTDIDVVFNKYLPGEPLPVGDDGSVALPLPFTFELCGESYDKVFVNANGNLTFLLPDGDFSESPAELLIGPPRIAPLWDDLNPSAGGLVTYDETRDTLIAIYEDVPEWPNQGSNSFKISLRKGVDNIEIEFGDVSAGDGVVGVSCGSGITSGFEPPTDLSEFPPSRINLQNQPAIYELFGFSGSSNDLAGTTLRFTGTSGYGDSWSEPNDNVREARRIRLPFDSIPIPRYTTIGEGGDVDFYRVTGEAGQLLVAQISGGDIDTVLGLFRIVGKGLHQRGTLLALDDDGGPQALSRLVFELPESGDYAIGVSTFPDFAFVGDGSGAGRYVLEARFVDPRPVEPGIVWAVDPAMSQIVQFDSPSGTPIGAFPTPEPPSGGPDGLARSGESLYFVNGQGTRTIWELDAETGAGIDDFRSPTPIDGLAFMDGYLFSLDFSTDTIIRIDPATGYVVDRCRTGLSAIGGLAAADGRLFVTSGYSRVVEMDFDSCLPRGPSFPVPFGGAAFGLGYDGAHLYVGDGLFGTVYIVDPDSGTVLDLFSVPFQPSALGP